MRQRTSAFLRVVLVECVLNRCRKVFDVARDGGVRPALAPVDKVEVLFRQQEGKVPHLGVRMHG